MDQKKIQQDNLDELASAAERASIRHVCEIFQEVDDPNQLTTSGELVLIKAVSSDNLEVIKFLLDHGLDVSCQNNLGQTALHCAIQDQVQWSEPHDLEPELDIIKLLLEYHPDLSLKTILGQTVWTYYKSCNWPELDELLDQELKWQEEHMNRKPPA